MKFDGRDVGYSLVIVCCVFFYVELMNTTEELVDIKTSTTPDYQGYESAYDAGYNNCLNDLTE